MGPTQILQNTHAEQPKQEKHFKIIRKMNSKNPPDLAEGLKASEVTYKLWPKKTEPQLIC